MKLAHQVHEIQIKQFSPNHFILEAFAVKAPAWDEAKMTTLLKQYSGKQAEIIILDIHGSDVTILRIFRLVSYEMK